MIILNLKKGKRLKFTYSVSDIHPENIKGNFVLEFNDSNVSFPIKINNNKIIVEITGNNKFLKYASGIIKAKLDIIADDTFITPWRGEVKIEKRKIKEFVVHREKDFVIEKSSSSVRKNSASLLEEKMKLIRKKLDNSEVKQLFDEKDINDPVFENFINTPIEEIIFTEEELDERKKERKMLSGILDTPIEELMDKVKEK